MEVWSTANPYHGQNPIPPPLRPAAARRTQLASRSVKPIPMRIISISKKRSQGIRLLAEEYMEKIRWYCVVEDVQIRSNPKNTAVVSAQIGGEDDMIMQHIKPDDWVVMLDENGTDIRSDQMADLIEEAGETVLTLSPVIFSIFSGSIDVFYFSNYLETKKEAMLGIIKAIICIGGSYGHGPKLRKRANIVIRLSSMVLNHQIALMVLLEQLYRVECICVLPKA